MYKRQAYNNQIKSLEKDLKEAYDKNDVEKVTKIMAEKKSLEQKSAKLDDNLIRMTPAELESVIDKVIDGVENEQTPNLENRLDRLEKLLINMNKEVTSSNEKQEKSVAVNQPIVDPNYSAVNDRLVQESNKLSQKIDEQNEHINTLKAQNQNVVAAAPLSLIHI